MELLLKDSAMKFIDNINTPAVETLYDQVTDAMHRAANRLATAERDGRLEWARFKRPAVYHLLKDALPAFARTDLNIGGNGDIINAVTKSHGPSWRMIVQLSAETEAYAVYPGAKVVIPAASIMMITLINGLKENTINSGSCMNQIRKTKRSNGS